MLSTESSAIKVQGDTIILGGPNKARLESWGQWACYKHTLATRYRQAKDSEKQLPAWKNELILTGCHSKLLDILYQNYDPKKLPPSEPIAEFQKQLPRYESKKYWTVGINITRELKFETEQEAQAKFEELKADPKSITLKLSSPEYKSEIWTRGNNG